MSAFQYRIVHFLPQPINGGQWPVAALVLVRGRVHVVRAGHMHHLCGCWAGKGALVDTALAMLEAASILRLEHAPDLGLHFSVTEPRSLPISTSQPLEWVRLHLLPRPPEREASTR